MDNPATQRCGRRFAFLFRIPAVNRQHIQTRAPNTNLISPNALPGGLVQQRVSRLRARARGFRAVPAQADDRKRIGGYKSGYIFDIVNNLSDSYLRRHE